MLAFFISGIGKHNTVIWRAQQNKQLGLEDCSNFHTFFIIFIARHFILVSGSMFIIKATFGFGIRTKTNKTNCFHYHSHRGVAGVAPPPENYLWRILVEWLNTSTTRISLVSIKCYSAYQKMFFLLWHLSWKSHLYIPYYVTLRSKTIQF